MAQLMLIADDLTGAFDTGVQFQKRGASVAFATLPQLAHASYDTDVVVADVETRHLSPDEAYARVAQAVRTAKAHGVESIYIKTDSGLRGQVGASIKAAMDVMGVRRAAFAPAYPDMKRTTVNGCQLIDSVPVHLSAFGRDPFDPVRAATIAEMLTPVGLAARVMPVSGGWSLCADAPTAMVFDTVTNEDFLPITKALQASGPWQVLAGCAGFAAHVPALIGLPLQPCAMQPLPAPLRVVCGSVHPATKAQVLHAEALGYARLVLSPEALAREGFTRVDDLQQLLLSGKPFVVDTGLTPAQADDLSALRQGVAAQLGQLVRDMLLLPGGADGTVMIIGGDTLMGFLSLLDAPQVRLEGEVLPGVVVFSVMLGGKRVRLASKSGGFGSENLLERLTATMI